MRLAAETAAQRGRRLLIVHGLDLATTQAVFGLYDLVLPAVAQKLREEGAARLVRTARPARRVDPELRVDTELSPAHPATVLIERSASAHLVTLGVGHGGRRAHLGSTVLAVTAHGHGDIVVVHDTGSEQRTRADGPVVVGFDGSPAAEAAAGAAFIEADIRGSSLVAVHAAGFTPHSEAGAIELLPVRELETAAQRTLTEQLAGWQEKYPEVRVTHKGSIARPRTLLTAWSKSAQLLVVGSRGRGGFRGLLLGSTSIFPVQHAHCPVMVAHGA
ncbi:universal stress protein [Nocardia sputi]|uniref:universal stress protein n=1 Tax=Nocardia sputi TaxID=2943705 RepID=UPI0020BF1573|nr:universal stress protein [Nocardia sputi]